jgi:hypothetical protein
MVVLKLISTLFYAYCAGIRYDVEYTSYDDYIYHVENAQKPKTSFPLETSDILWFDNVTFYTEIAFLFQVLLNCITEQKPVDSL